ncbi:hypothetical protein ACFL6K_01030 [Candidatus Latescibacterota bacterium]
MYKKSNKKVILIVCAAAAVLALAALFVIKNKEGVEYTQIVEGEKLVISVQKGDSWSSVIEGGLFSKKSNAPQMAFWLEDMDGKFKATLYVTRQTAVQDWPDKSYREGRDNLEKQAVLPIWTYKHIMAGVHPIDTCSMCHDRVKSSDKSIDDKPYLDAFTGATPSGSFVREVALPPGLESGRYVVCAEINNVIDYNDRFQDELPQQFNRYNGISGQPSLFLAGFISTGGRETIAVLNLAGHGHPAGKDGMVYSDMTGITTAKDIVQSVDVRYFPRDRDFLKQ